MGNDMRNKIFVFLIIIFVGGEATSEERVPPFVTFYNSDHFKKALAAADDVIQLVRRCKLLYPSECDGPLYKGYNELENFNSQLVLFNELFFLSKKKYEDEKFENIAHLHEALSDRYESFVFEERQFEIDYVAQYSVLADRCGGDSERSWINTASSINFRAVWGEAPDIFEKTKEIIVSRKKKFSEMINGSDLGFCKDALKFGSLLGLPYRDRFDKSAYDVGLYSDANFLSRKMLNYVFAVAGLMNSKINESSQ